MTFIRALGQTSLIIVVLGAILFALELIMTVLSFLFPWAAGVVTVFIIAALVIAGVRTYG